MTYQDFIQTLAKSPLRPAYLIAGDDPLAVDDAVKRLLAQTLAGADPMGCVAYFDGAEAEPATVLDEVRTVPLWGPRRVAVVERAGEFLDRAGDAVRAYLKNVKNGSAPGVLVLVARDVSAPVTTFKRYGEVVVLVACSAPRRAQDRIRWLVERASARGRSLAGPDARLLLDLVGADLLALDSQIEKLTIYVGARKAIRREDIEALVAPTRVEPMYELGDALTARDVPRALRLAEDLLAEGIELAPILGAVRAHLRRFWRIKQHRAAGHSPAEAARALGESQRAWLVEKLYGQTDRFSDAELGRCFSELLKADLATKTGALPEALALERFVIAACGRTR
jgi:DNA polymerase-3 subunit delta